MKTAFVLTTLLAFVTFSAGSHAATPVGEIEKASGSASASGPAGTRSITTGSKIFLGDTIKTGGSIDLQILFLDQTKLVIGPSSTLKVDQFVLKKNNTASKFAIRAARGTFRFITGKSSKSAYKIFSRSATIGIRGTGFDFNATGRTSVVLYTGEITVCIGGNCRNLDRKCQMVRETNSSLFKTTTGELPPNAYRLTFPYIRAESRLLENYRLGAGVCDASGSQGPAGGGGGDNSGNGDGADTGGGGDTGGGNAGSGGTGSP